jgi:hypothetical protein
MGAEPSPASPPADRRLRSVAAVLAALLVVAAIVIGVLLARGGEEPDAGAPIPSPTVIPSPPASTTPATPDPSATASPTPGSTAVPLPASCDALYSPAMVAAYGRMVLNPPWLDDPELELRIGEDDPVLQGVLDDSEVLLCQWVMPEGPSGAGVSTTVATIDDEQTGLIVDHLRDRGDSCFAERGGIRCTTAGSNDEGYFGESHFLRDGVWIATEYSNAGPEGYTLDIVNNLWPDD